ncbi:hypothetical protein EWT52_07910 [Escherichia coli O25b:H4]|nr:hypothetical protein EWT52_07910 [Escherichia coli O25b:H4]
MESSGPGWKLLMEHHLDQGRESLESDVVIFATGYRSALPQILPSLMPLITMHDKNTFKVRDDFTLEWSGPKRTTSSWSTPVCKPMASPNPSSA